MKTKAILILLFPLLLFSCSKNDGNEGSEGNSKVPVVVQVQPEAEYISTKPDVRSFSRAPRAGGKGPLTAMPGAEVNMAYAKYAALETNINYTIALDGVVNSAGKTSFTPLLFYPPEDDQRIALKGFHPRVDDDRREGAVIQDNKVEYTITGQEDIMVSKRIDAWRNWTFESQNTHLEYNHLLTQFTFAMRCTGGFPETLTIQEIRLTGLYTDAVLDLMVEEGASYPATTYLDHTLTFPKSGKQPQTLYACKDEEIILQENFSKEAFPVMFEPGAELGLEIEFSTGRVVTIDKVMLRGGSQSDADNLLKGNTKRGVHYTVHLTFKCIGAQPVASAEWIDVDVDWKDEGDDNWW